ncbi:serine/threonine-protein kinase [Gordonia liuliyuniae]|uniref:non-specific serine/threonine protein kinase n=1 Tax=Gordonia liuliyuniae TaxID=2911517 RepID=A0ABS9IXU0_9ACTN|nr:serine/threonine-protein kinase [Gordonia liuliyuniae]MCF8590393.1 serine/threonine protein kinase [Gordonia liuliyuniae]
MSVTEIAGYRVLRLLGAGGMGQVFLAEHPRLPRHDAVKLLDAGVSRSDDFKERFRREADVLAQLSHPNIVTLYDRGEVDGRLWISMEYVAGTDAAEMVAKRGPLDRELVLALVGGAGAALDHAWRKRRVTHRDVKPANILVGLDESDGDARIESVKLADFGIAKAAGEATSLTATGLTVGTMQYTSPEAIEGRELNNRADVYSLGCTAFHLLTGRPPYSGSSITALLSAHLHQAPPRVNDVAPSVDAVFAKVLAKDPALRYASCGEFVDDLARALDGGAGPAFDRTLTAASMPPGDVARGEKNRTAVYAVATLAVVLAVGVAAALGVYIARDDGSPATDAAPVTSSSQPTRVTRTVTAPATSTTAAAVPEGTWTPEEALPVTTTEDAVPYEGKPCGPDEFGATSDDGTLRCSALEGGWVDTTHEGHATVQFGAPCSEPGARARVTATERIVTCRAAASGGSYSWQD